MLAEQALLVALSTWSPSSDETVAAGLTAVLDRFDQAPNKDDVFACTLVIAARALVDLSGDDDGLQPGSLRDVQLRRAEAVRYAAALLRRLGGEGGGPGALGVREPRRPRPESPKDGAQAPREL